MLTDHRSSRRRGRRTTVLAGLAVVLSFLLVSCTPDTAHDDPAASGTAPGTGTASTPERGRSSGTGANHGPAGEQDGVLPDRTSAYDTSLPGIAKLDPALRKAVQRAETAMKEDGITMQVTTGWRSKKYQEELLEKAIRKYGSKKKAMEYVADPDESHHVTGHAVDIGPTAADYWLIRHGSRFGLCQTLSNEIWHFELATEPGGTCPPMTDPTR
ncbi:M15 family metallopeptidase [Kribbella sp. HUAS MG21]|uniref:M15 family metallopeptidase n=1 Tax=Kribbella sp. HUAS MG21 TaxID=3160966 RepID=A0AAU7TN66_9ACTN